MGKKTKINRLSVITQDNNIFKEKNNNNICTHLYNVCIANKISYINKIRM